MIKKEIIIKGRGGMMESFFYITPFIVFFIFLLVLIFGLASGENIVFALEASFFMALFMIFVIIFFLTIIEITNYLLDIKVVFSEDGKIIAKTDYKKKIVIQIDNISSVSINTSNYINLVLKDGKKSHLE